MSQTYSLNYSDYRLFTPPFPGQDVCSMHALQSEGDVFQKHYKLEDSHDTPSDRLGTVTPCSCQPSSQPAHSATMFKTSSKLGAGEENNSLHSGVYFKRPASLQHRWWQRLAHYTISSPSDWETVPQLYQETKENVTEALKKAPRATLTWCMDIKCNSVIRHISCWLYHWWQAAGVWCFTN